MDAILQRLKPLCNIFNYNTRDVKFQGSTSNGSYKYIHVFACVDPRNKKFEYAESSRWLLKHLNYFTLTFTSTTTKLKIALIAIL